MTRISSRNIFSMAAAGICVLAACQDGDSKTPTSTQGEGSVVIAPAEMPTAETLPTDADGLQAFIIESFRQGRTDDFDRAVEAYVLQIDDRRVQRDFVNYLWKEDANIENSRMIALPIATRLSDEYDVSAPTYYVGAAYWSPIPGVQKDLGKVIEYWSKPSQTENATVQYRLAKIFLDETSGHYDRDRGQRLMQVAADGGNADARLWLDSQ